MKNRNTITPLLIYVIIIVLVSAHPELTPVFRTLFFLYASFIYWIIWHRGSTVKKTPASPKEAKFFRYLLIGSILFFIVSRMFMFLVYGEAPLGYDTGFYLQAFDGLPGEIQGDRGLRTLIWIPFSWLGMSPVFVLHGLYVLFQFFILGALYTLMRTLAIGKRLPYAAVVIFIFAASAPQFFAYWWMFYQMHLAIGMLLLSLALFHRRSILVLLTFSFGAALHPATFLPFLGAGALFLMYRAIDAIRHRKMMTREERFMLGVGILGLVVALLFGRSFIASYLQYSVGQYGWFYTNFPAHQQLQFTGLYIDSSLYRLASLYFVPFSTIGILLFVMRRIGDEKGSVQRRLGFLFSMLLCLLFVTYYPFIYQHRFLIILDLVLILFATYALVSFFQFHLRDRGGGKIIAILITGLIISASYFVVTQKPQLYADEREEIVALSQNTHPSVFVMTTESLYTPWVLAFSKRQILDPGFLQQNKWNYEMWDDFWAGNSNERRHQLLRMYNRPIYIFIGRSVPDHVPYKRFIKSDESFIQVSPHVWYYDPRILPVTSPEIINTAL